MRNDAILTQAEKMMELAKQVKFSEYVPVGHLANYIKSIYYFDFSYHFEDWPTTYRRSIMLSEIQRILPFPSSDIIFQSEPSFVIIDSRTKNEYLLPEIFASPLSSSPILIRKTGSAKIFGIKLLPWCKSFFFGYKKFELKEVADLRQHQFFKPELVKQIWKSPVTNSFMFLESLMLDFVSKVDKKNNDKITYPIVEEILEKNGKVDILNLSENAGFSLRYIEHRFNKTLGMSPKLFARLVKFQHCFEYIQNNQQMKFSEIALNCGYFDQAHFIKEFGFFAGITPKAYFKETNLISYLMGARGVLQ